MIAVIKMEDIEIEEKRRIPFAYLEKTYLKQLVLKNSHIIENKKTDSATVLQKQRCWKDIEKDFNSVEGHTKRTVSQLRKCWENIKTRKKEKEKKLAREIDERMRNGGGSFVPYMFTEDSDPAVHMLVCDSANEGMVKSLDGDGVIVSSFEESVNLSVPLTELTEPASTTVLEEKFVSRDEIEIKEKLPPLSPPVITTTFGKTAGKKCLSFVDTRTAAIKKEMEFRLKRAERQDEREEELHQLRKEELVFKKQESFVRLKIAEEILKQEQIKTKRLMERLVDNS